MEPIFGIWTSNQVESAPEEVVLCIRSENNLEVQCHGGEMAKQRIIEDLSSVGCRQVGWAESLEQTCTADAARAALPYALTEKSAAVLLWQAEGSLDQAISQAICDLRANDLAAAESRLHKLVDISSLGLHCTSPWRVVIAGRANVGKSSLMNRILGYQRSIIYDTPGTTRDLLTGATAIRGWALEFVDTAGLRESSDPVEHQGTWLSRLAIRQADVVLILVDIFNQQISPMITELVRDQRGLVAINKCDLANPKMTLTQNAVTISAMTGQGLDELLNRVIDRLVPNEPKPQQPIPFQQHQVDLLTKCLDCLRQQEVDKAISLLSSLVKS